MGWCILCCLHCNRWTDCRQASGAVPASTAGTLPCGRVSTCWQTLPPMTLVSPVGHGPTDSTSARWPLPSSAAVVSVCRGGCHPAQWTPSLPPIWKPCSRANLSCSFWRLSGESPTAMCMASSHTHSCLQGGQLQVAGVQEGHTVGLLAACQLPGGILQQVGAGLLPHLKHGCRQGRQWLMLGAAAAHRADPIQ